MFQPTLKIVFNRRKTASTVKRGTVEIEVYHNRQRAWISTKVYLYKTQWSRGQVVNKPDADLLNKKIAKVYSCVMSEMKRQYQEGVVDLSRLKNLDLESGENMLLFMDWLKHQIESNPEIRESTRRQHMVMYRALSDFGKLVYFSDVNLKNIRAFDAFIRRRGITLEAIRNYHKRLRPYITLAQQLEMIEKNPYSLFRPKRGRVEKIRYLTREERGRVESLQLTGPVEKARDMFIFSCYTGLAYCDIVKIKEVDVFTKDGHKFISDKRLKTGTPYMIVLPEKAVEILERYDYHMDLMSN